MKAYKLFSLTQSGALRSYNVPGNINEYLKECFSPLLLKYEPGQWREPEIEGTGLFCLSNEKINYLGLDAELWEVEAEGQITFDKLVFDAGFGDEGDVTKLIDNKQYVSRHDLAFLLEMFPNTVIYQRVKPIRKVR
jgi:hypothetical protein